MEGLLRPDLCFVAVPNVFLLLASMYDLHPKKIHRHDAAIVIFFRPDRGIHAALVELGLAWNHGTVGFF